MLYGVLGNPVSQSLSPAIQGAAFGYYGIEAEYRRFELTEKEFREFIPLLRQNHIAGLTVTMPFKELIIPYLDEIDPVAQHIGAVNTLKVTPTALIGYNTDYFGALRALRERIGLEGKRVLLLGAGGAAKAIAYGLHEQGATIFVYTRNRSEETPDFMNKFCVHNVELEAIHGADYDVIINATPVGMVPHENESVLHASQMAGCPLVMDIVYKPLETLFLRYAKEAGAEVITGEKMLLYQGAKQFEIWQGREAPVEVMREALIRNLTFN